ncbi:MAG: 4-alpha-glucanotransferase [Gemmatimonadaceae bacterium]
MTRPRLRELAERLGIISEYVDQTGRSVRRTSDGTRESLLAVMGFDTPTEDAARGWLSELDHEEREAVVAPVRVVQRDDPSANRVRVRLPDGIASADVELTLREESGHVWQARKHVRRAATLELPTPLPYGYHALTAQVQWRGGARSAEQSLIVVPASCVTPAMLLDRRTVVGIVANLYSVRREHDWGIGDFGTLTQLVEWAAGRGVAFVGVNPLHALVNRGMDISPYSPVSRLFRNTIYVDVDSVAELEHSETAKAILNSPATRATLRELSATTLVDYDGVIELKGRILTELHRTFRARGGVGGRTREYEDFVRLRDPELTRFATWMTIAEDSGVPDWRQWPAAMREPDSEAVRAFQSAHAERIDFHRWVQFEAQQQLAAVALRGRVLGMRIGVYQDLAIGSSGGGSDTWSYPDLFLSGAAIGAPPDPYSATGQNWGLPPMSPRGLRMQRYRYWIELLRRTLEHSGALRIDHVMGLFRAFWIPDGGTGKDGAYVRFPSDDLLGILALESVRHNALVVGEDLGTIPKEVPPALKRRGILSSKVLYFERDRQGFKPAARYPALALATANTHDMPTLAGFWKERDIELRAQVGLLRTPAEVLRAKRERAAEKQALLRLLRLPSPPHYEERQFPRKLTVAAHEFLCSTPSALVGESLDDLLGEVDPVNVPGVGPDKYPSWRRKTRMTMEEISWSFSVDDAVRCADRRSQ